MVLYSGRNGTRSVGKGSRVRRDYGLRLVGSGEQSIGPEILQDRLSGEILKSLYDGVSYPKDVVKAMREGGMINVEKGAGDEDRVSDEEKVAMARAGVRLMVSQGRRRDLEVMLKMAKRSLDLRSVFGEGVRRKKSDDVSEPQVQVNYIARFLDYVISH